MVVCGGFVAFWSDAAPNAAAASVRALVYWPFAITGLAAALSGIWLLALYLLRYLPQLNRARFDMQTSMILELQQQVKQLQENIAQEDR